MSHDLISCQSTCSELGNYIVATRCTIRDASAHFGVPKSTVHIHVTRHLSQFDPVLAQEVRKVLDTNLKERHIRGGQATRVKYQNARK